MYMCLVTRSYTYMSVALSFNSTGIKIQRNSYEGEKLTLKPICQDIVMPSFFL